MNINVPRTETQKCTLKNYQDRSIFVRRTINSAVFRDKNHLEIRTTNQQMRVKYREILQKYTKKDEDSSIFRLFGYFLPPNIYYIQFYRFLFGLFGYAKLSSNKNCPPPLTRTDSDGAQKPLLTEDPA
eukprot:GEMP01076280.1.p1 GENE.GEMP01076280.1~~GEMP01076280.1.p1  ORF type:complete len:128 (-),score=5.24 GEMP01076280.1:634-1017(-)